MIFSFDEIIDNLKQYFRIDPVEIPSQLIISMFLLPRYALFYQYITETIHITTNLNIKVSDSR